uniref:SFRICE_038104 n=1 Tax=Spodoptera frugiperda TaxID=7108 RepID=A0A2H1VZG6_SPOFR
MVQGSTTFQEDNQNKREIFRKNGSITYSNTLLVNEQSDHLMVSNRRRPWTLETLKALKVRCRPFGRLNNVVSFTNKFDDLGRKQVKSKASIS